MIKEWSAMWSNKVYLGIWITLLFIVLATLKLISVFLIFNENRTGGVILDDWVLNNVDAVDVSTPLFAITWICIFVCLPIALRTPKRAMVVFVSILAIGVLRSICLYLVPLEPPIGIIPLRDTFLEGSFYDNRVLVKDLFFSGHTANLALLIFLVDIKWIKYVLVICTFIIAFLLLKQHVHYTIDVVVAPFAAFLSYQIAKNTVDFIFKKINTESGISKSAMEVV